MLQSICLTMCDDMKFLEELKAAQEVCEMCHCHVCENTYFDKYERDCIEAALRRIPQLIELLEALDSEDKDRWTWDKKEAFYKLEGKK